MVRHPKAWVGGHMGAEVHLGNGGGCNTHHCLRQLQQGGGWGKVGVTEAGQVRRGRGRTAMGEVGEGTDSTFTLEGEGEGNNL